MEYICIYDIENDYLSDKGILITKISPVEFSSQYILIFLIISHSRDSKFRPRTSRVLVVY